MTLELEWSHKKHVFIKTRSQKVDLHWFSACHVESTPETWCVHQHISWWESSITVLKMGYTMPLLQMNKSKNKNLRFKNVIRAVIIRSTKHHLINIKTESWVAVEVTNSFLWTWMSWAKLRCLHNLLCSNNIPHAYFSLKRNSMLGGILGSRPE